MLVLPCRQKKRTQTCNTCLFFIKAYFQLFHMERAYCSKTKTSGMGVVLNVTIQLSFLNLVFSAPPKLRDEDLFFFFSLPLTPHWLLLLIFNGLLIVLNLSFFIRVSVDLSKTHSLSLFLKLLVSHISQIPTILHHRNLTLRLG